MAPSSLGVLNLSFNKLSKLPSALGASPVLQQMYLANNRCGLTNTKLGVPCGCFPYRTPTSLHVSRAGRVHPDTRYAASRMLYWCCIDSPGLTPCDLTHSLAPHRLEELPPSFSQLPMVDLFLSENEFTTIPKAVLGA